MSLDHQPHAPIPGQLTIDEEFERRRAWDQLAAGGVIAPFFEASATPRSDAAIFANRFLQALSDLS